MPKMNRRDMLKMSGLAAGTLAIGSALPGCNSDDNQSHSDPTQKNSMLADLPPYYPGTETLGKDEMRITFMGTTPIAMISQAAVSVFVELGNGDCFSFDLGTGSMIKYWAMKVNMDKIYKVFIAHLHADHMGDIPFVYGFGPSYGRLWPMYIWGPTRSGLTYTDPDNNTRGPFNDGTADYCAALQQMLIWHNESQSFEPTSLKDYKLPDFDTTHSTLTDGYDFVVKELPWKNTGKDANGVPNGDNVAYDYNGAKITHFPAVHTRQGSISYKLEWNGLSMIYIGDTLPSQYVIDQALPGVDVLIHEIVMSAANWITKMGITTDKYSQTIVDAAVAQSQSVQDSSHTPQKAYGYILQQIKEKGVAPRLAVGTHFQATDDTIKTAMSDIRTWYPKGDVIIASDTMVVNVTRTGVKVRRGVVSNYQWPIQVPNVSETNTPKYWMTDPQTGKPTAAPQAQLDPDALENYVIDSSKYNAK